MLWIQYCVISLTLQLPNEIYIPQEWSCSGLNGSCFGSCCTLCCNSFFVPRQYINFMSQQAMTGSLCRAKQCLIGFWSMATPPEACFPLLFQQHLERNGGDYILPAVSRWFSPRRPSGNTLLTVTVHAAPLPCSAAGKPRAAPAVTVTAAVNAAAAKTFCYSAAETSTGSKGIMIIQNQINCLLHKPGLSWDPKQHSNILWRHKMKVVYFKVKLICKKSWRKVFFFFRETHSLHFWSKINQAQYIIESFRFRMS